MPGWPLADGFTPMRVPMHASVTKAISSLIRYRFRDIYSAFVSINSRTDIGCPQNHTALVTSLMLDPLDPNVQNLSWSFVGANTVTAVRIRPPRASQVPSNWIRGSL